MIESLYLTSDSEVSAFMVGRTIKTLYKYESTHVGFRFTDKSEIQFTAMPLDGSRYFGVIHDEIVYDADIASLLSPVASVKFSMNELHPVYKDITITLVVVTTASGVIVQIPFAYTDQIAKLVCYLMPS